MNSDPAFELRKFVAPEFVFGCGALALTGRYAKNFGAKKALIVTDAGVVQAGWTEKAIGSLDAEHVPWALFQDVTPNPKDHEVAAGVRFYQGHECDVIVAVGGGSPMDCAKGIAIASANDKNVLEFEGVDKVPLPGPPLICIPTTSGTSADVSATQLNFREKGGSQIMLADCANAPLMCLGHDKTVYIASHRAKYHLRLSVSPTVKKFRKVPETIQSGHHHPQSRRALNLTNDPVTREYPAPPHPRFFESIRILISLAPVTE